MKDFEKEYLKEDDLPKNTDPYLFTTPEVREQMLLMQSQAVSNVSMGQLMAMLVSAPLTTITASLQLSVKPHKHIYQEPASKSSTQLMKINTALTLQQKRKMQLVLRMGGQRRPYAAPVYEGYRATIRDLAKQGWQAFFKGLLFRSIHQLGAFYAYYEVGILESNSTGRKQALDFTMNVSKLWILQVLSSMSLNLFHIAQNRYILQNNISEFKVFRNASKVIRKILSRREFLTGASYHFFNASFEVLLRYPLYLSMSTGNMTHFALGGVYLIQLLLYPLNTAFRRLLCQHSQIPGMIPIRYRGLWHALRLIGSEEGILGLYKGFGLHHLTLGLRVAAISYVVPMLLQLQFKKE